MLMAFADVKFGCCRMLDGLVSTHPLDYFANIRLLDIGNCDIHGEQKISAMNESKWHKIWAKPKVLVKNFCNLPPSFLKAGLNIFHFKLMKVYKRKSKGSFMLKKPLFLPTRTYLMNFLQFI